MLGDVCIKGHDTEGVDPAKDPKILQNTISYPACAFLLVGKSDRRLAKFNRICSVPVLC